jgi:hypothetical protein
MVASLWETSVWERMRPSRTMNQPTPVVINDHGGVTYLVLGFYAVMLKINISMFDVRANEQWMR